MTRIQDNTLRATVLTALFVASIMCLCPPGIRAGGFPGGYVDMGGHVRLRGAISCPADGSHGDILERERLHDGTVEFRSTNTVHLSPSWRLDLHYEALGTTGETGQATAALFSRYPLEKGLISIGDITDDRRLMDLSHVITEHDDYRVYHRLDRLVLTTQRDWGSLRIGRQALTWGNGFLFNPMDLFNPFAPTDVERDYKRGDDMVILQAYMGTDGEIQLLAVPRRNKAGDIDGGESSIAAKYHSPLGNIEWDMMAGLHYDDYVIGTGLVGYLGSAAWRFDATYTWLPDDSTRKGFGSLCANMDYSWTWGSKNMYGWVEYSYTGLGTTDYGDTWKDNDILGRIDRGERTTLGRSYVDTQVQVELHPLVNAYVTLIANLTDPSTVIQPRVTWNAAQNIQVTAGVTIYAGGRDTEFGGFDIPMLPFREEPADGLYLWVSYYY